ncbi:MAG: ATP-grasp domain-containing protein [Cyclobacteriaceae bacterium]
MTTNNLSVYTSIIANEAINRGISVSGYTEININHAILEYNGHREFISQSKTGRIGHTTYQFLFDKWISHELLLEDGFPVPDTILTNNISEINEFLKKHKEIVIKPTDSTGGKGITNKIRVEEMAKVGLEIAQKVTSLKDKKVVVQKHLEGFDYRVLVINYEHVFAVKRTPAYIVGDGLSSMKKLINSWNKTLVIKNRKIKLNSDLEGFLAKQNYTLESIPEKNAMVSLNNLSNAHQGGIVTDVTDSLLKEVSEISIDICKKYQCPILGIDYMSNDISKEVGKIIELNPHAGLTVHVNPTFGKTRNVGEKIVDMLFPETVHPIL